MQTFSSKFFMFTAGSRGILYLFTDMVLWCYHLLDIYLTHFLFKREEVSYQLPGTTSLVGKSIDKFQDFGRVIRKGALVAAISSDIYGSALAKCSVLVDR